MLDTQTEIEAIADIKAICEKHFKSFEIVIIRRVPVKKSQISYFAEIGVLVREGEISQAFFGEIFTKLFQEKDCLFEFLETKRDIHNLSFEELYIRAKISVS